MRWKHVTSSLVSSGNDLLSIESKEIKNITLKAVPKDDTRATSYIMIFDSIMNDVDDE
ncbi:hypothetical protein HDU85_005902 [Gaertneriomyces sp. JEL0708]|nr:hypothetical protein HDU85_005902 [Gaertneriomyces sp. JEL0708]